MADKNKTGKEVTDPAILAQLNADEPKTGKEVTDPTLLAQLNGEEPQPSPQKKSPAVSVTGSGSSLQDGQTTVTGSEEPATQEGVNKIFGTSYNEKGEGQPIVNLQPKPETELDPKAKAADAANTLAVHVMQNAKEGATPEYLDNLNNTPFDQPGSVVHDITNPHGDPKMTGDYTKYGVEQLKLKKQGELTALANSGDYQNPDYHNEIDAINSKYDKQIGELYDAGKHITKLQYANREYASNKMTQEEADKKIEDLHDEYKKELEVATGAGDVSLAKSKYDIAKAAVKKDTKYDATQLGIEQRVALGDKTAADDLVKYHNGQPLDEDRKVAYQASGLGIIQTGAANAAANGQEDAAKEMAANSDNIQERLEKDNPNFFKRQYANQVGSYLYNNEHNPLFGSLFARGELSEDELKDAGKKAGLTPEQIRKINPADVPTTASWPGEAAQGAFNSFLGQNEKDPYGELFTGKMPQEQHSFNDWRGITGEIAGGAGTVGGFLAQGGILGEGLKGAELLGNVAKNAKRYETAANMIPLAVSNYNNAYETSKDVIGDKPEDALKRHAYALLNATLSTAIMSIDPATKIGSDAIGASGPAGKGIVQILKEGGLSDLSKDEFESQIQKVIKGVAKTSGVTAQHMASQSFIMGANKAAENVTDMFFDPEHRHGILDNVGQSAVQGGIAMALPSLLAGVNAARSQSPANKALVWDVANNAPKYRQQITDAFNQGTMSPDEYNTAQQGIYKAVGALYQTPEENKVSGNKLTDNQRQDYAWNMMRSNDLNGKLQQLNAEPIQDKSQLKIVEDKLGELTNERIDILNNAGNDKPIKKPELKPQEKLNQAPTPERSVATDANPAPPASATKKTSAESEKPVPLSPQEQEQQNKTNDHGKNGNEVESNEGRQDGTKISETEVSGPNPELRQAASLEGSEERDNEVKPVEGNEKTEPVPQEQAKRVFKSKKGRNLGVTDEPVSEIPQTKKDQWAAWDHGTEEGKPEAETDKKVEQAKDDEKIGGGESFNEFKDRIKSAYESFKATAKDNTLLIAHSGVKRMIDAAEKVGWDNTKELRSAYNETAEMPRGEVEIIPIDKGEAHIALHGETDDNQAKVDRQKNAELTEEGEATAKEIADKLKEQDIQPKVIESSPLPRSTETADIIHNELTKPEENASPQIEEQQQEGHKQSGKPEHARTEQARSEEAPASAESGDSNIGGEKEKIKDDGTDHKLEYFSSLDKKEREDYIDEIKNKDIPEAKSGIDKAKSVKAKKIYQDQLFYLQDKLLPAVEDIHARKEKSGEKLNQAPTPERSVATDLQPEDKASATKLKLKQLEDNLRQQKASQQLEGKLRDKAEKEGDTEAANKHNKNWYTKKDKIDKLQDQRDELTKELYRQRAEDAVDNLNKNRETRKGDVRNGAALPWLDEKVHSFLMATIKNAIEMTGNVHIGIRRAIRETKEKFGELAGKLSYDHIESLKAASGDDYSKYKPTDEPVLPIDHEEYAKDIIADVKSGKISYEEARQEVDDEEFPNREGKPLSDHVQENIKAKIRNYIDWHIDNDLTSIKNDTTRLRREQYGLNEEVPAAEKEFGKTWKEAKDKIEDNPRVGQNLVEELSHKARPLNDVENAILLHHQNTKEIEFMKLNTGINKAADEGDLAKMAEYRVSKASVLDELQKIYDVNKAVGTENARGLASRRMMVDRKFSLVNMITEKRATANDGKALSEKQQAEVEAANKKIKETQDAFDDYVKKAESQIIDLQHKALSGRLKDKKTASAKLRSWANRIRESAKNQAYSSPIPITPHMVADAIDLIATGVEAGEKLVDLVKKAVKKAGTDNPGINEQHLEKEINKELIDSGILEPSKERREANDVSGLFKNGNLDYEAVRLKAAADREKGKFEHQLRKDGEKNVPVGNKVLDLFVKTERAFKLSSPLTMAKLMAAGFARLAIHPAEEAVGGVYSKIFPKLAKGAIGEGGGLNTVAYAKAIASGFKMWGKDASQIMKTGKSDLDIAFSNGQHLPPEAMEFFGHLHSAEKAPFKRAIIEYSLQKRIQNAIANGVDVTDPLVMGSIGIDAYKDGNRAIFMQDNSVADFYNQKVKELEKINPKTRKPESDARYVLSKMMQFLIPFAKIPSNIVAESARNIYGLPVGLTKAIYHSFKGDIETLPSEEKDMIMRNLKKGTLGVAALLYGFYFYNKFGGFYQSGNGWKKKEDEPDWGGVEIGGEKIPQTYLEAPIFQAMQMGATYRKVLNHKIKGQEEGILPAVWAAASGLSEENPLLGEPLHLTKLWGNPYEQKQFIGELVKSTLIPAGVSYIAKSTDPADKGNPVRKALAPENKRKIPKTISEHIEGGVPGLRENLEDKNPEPTEGENYVVPR